MTIASLSVVLQSPTTTHGSPGSYSGLRMDLGVLCFRIGWKGYRCSCADLQSLLIVAFCGLGYVLPKPTSAFTHLTTVGTSGIITHIDNRKASNLSIPLLEPQLTCWYLLTWGKM